MTRTHTRTFVTLDIPSPVFDEIKARLSANGYKHAFVDEAIDMSGIGLTRRTDDETTKADAEGALQSIRTQIDDAEMEVARLTRMYGDSRRQAQREAWSGLDALTGLSERIRKIKKFVEQAPPVSEINLNAVVVVKLTRRGKDALEAYADGALIDEPQPMPDGRYAFQLHQLAHIFGADMEVGAPELFEDMNMPYEMPG